MGCAKFLLSLFAFWIFTGLGWIALPAGASLFWSVFWISIIVSVIDFLLLGVDILIRLLSLPASCLTFGLFGIVVKGILKYFSLYLAAYFTGLFVLPWIFGPMWIQAIVIGVVFAIIGGMRGSSSVRVSSSSSLSSRSRFR